MERSLLTPGGMTHLDTAPRAAPDRSAARLKAIWADQRPVLSGR
jgi:hypothetical protein